MKQIVIVINGKGGVGKDTIVKAVSKHFAVQNESVIDPIKKAADVIGWGWDGNDKTSLKSRKFLADLMDLSSEYNDFPFEYIMECYKRFACGTYQVMFIHAREPRMIERIKQAIPDCKTLLIRRGAVEKEYGNHADDEVENYDYDFVYANEKPLDEVEDDFMKFFNTEIMN